MTKHTPAPWKAHKTNLARSGVPEFQIHWSIDGECIAEIVHGEANANLIAAAPEMYEALEDILLYCEVDELGVRERAQAAIAKAEGK